MLRAIASSPHDLRPIFQPSLTGQCVCAEERGNLTFRLVEKQAFVRCVRAEPLRALRMSDLAAEGDIASPCSISNNDPSRSSRRCWYAIHI